MYRLSHIALHLLCLARQQCPGNCLLLCRKKMSTNTTSQKEKLVNNRRAFTNVRIDDDSNLVVLPTTPPTPAKTTWTLLIYLTGPSTGCIGGETLFHPELGPAKKFSGKENDGSNPIVVGLEVGMALLHKHGQDCLLHEGREVTQGEKWVIRSDLCVKR